MTTADGDSMSERTEPWNNPDPEHFHFEPVEADANWQVVPLSEQKPCRWTLSARVQCREPSAAKLNRSQRGTTVWWHYCGEHMYGRWVEDGTVYQWRLVANEPASAS